MIDKFSHYGTWKFIPGAHHWIQNPSSIKKIHKKLWLKMSSWRLGTLYNYRAIRPIQLKTQVFSAFLNTVSWLANTNSNLTTSVPT
jgi:hypothetical protein